MMSQWLLMMVSYDEPLVVNHGLLCCVNGCESWHAMLSQWLLIMVCYTELEVVIHALPVVAKHGVVC